MTGTMINEASSIFKTDQPLTRVSAYEAGMSAIREKTARLRALRLAKEADEKMASTAQGREVTKSVDNPGQPTPLVRGRLVGV